MLIKFVGRSPSMNIGFEPVMCFFIAATMIRYKGNGGKMPTNIFTAFTSTENVHVFAILKKLLML